MDSIEGNVIVKQSVLLIKLLQCTHITHRHHSVSGDNGLCRVCQLGFFLNWKIYIYILHKFIVIMLKIN